MKLTKKIGINLLSLLASTWRINSNTDRDLENSVIAFWHSDMLPVWYHFKNKEHSAIVSKSKDGEILSKLLQKWNYKVLRGSSSKGGKEVLDIAIELLKSGNTLLITPDGPRGPANEFKPGAVIASVRTSSPLYFCTVNINNYKTFNTWDKFKVPLPFTKIELIFSEKYEFEGNDSRENINKIIGFLTDKYRS